MDNLAPVAATANDRRSDGMARHRLPRNTEDRAVPAMRRANMRGARNKSVSGGFTHKRLGADLEIQAAGEASDDDL